MWQIAMLVCRQTRRGGPFAGMKSEGFPAFLNQGGSILLSDSYIASQSLLRWLYCFFSFQRPYQSKKKRLQVEKG
jgi:hypothetical protein